MEAPHAYREYRQPAGESCRGRHVVGVRVSFRRRERVGLRVEPTDSRPHQLHHIGVRQSRIAKAMSFSTPAGSSATPSLKFRSFFRAHDHHPHFKKIHTHTHTHTPQTFRWCAVMCASAHASPPWWMCGWMGWTSAGGGGRLFYCL